MMTRNQPLPMTVLAGFLGAGKTTLVNHLLRHSNGQKIMVLVNDFGELPIDQDLIAAQDGDILTLANGCACCSMGGDLYKAFDAALSFSPAPDHLLIEASGVAEPTRIANFARAEPDLTLNSIITMVDAANFDETISKPRLSDIVEAQVSTAHMILLNKCDLASAQELSKCEILLKELNSKAPVLKITRGKLSSEVFFGAEMDPPEGDAISDKPHSHSHEADFARWSLQTDCVIDKTTLRDGLANLPSSILRFKGIFRAKGEAKLWTVHKVGPHVNITPLSPDITFSGKTGFVAIGLQGTSFEKSLNATFQFLEL